ncbi:hypothetical protein G7032_19430 [Pseudomonas monteilii]|uniref:hypothetical protein n=1 Tax=Pseudomonas monteilii TaxID=76759 RepID=UPI0015E43892|nr:hypothetical protein [Pseudomonas monteilii]MBA1318026.1 hypothetical protein [Pseudomonas monteilii]
MDTNKMREQFIRAYRRILIAEGMMIQESRFELRDGEFVHRETAVAWWAWQASREAVVVELPSEDTCRTSTAKEEAVQETYNHALGECRAALEAQGLKVAP